MGNLFKMDIRQLFCRKTMYFMIVVMGAVTFSMLFLSDVSTLSMETVLGVMNSVSTDNFMLSANGLGFVYPLLCIMLSFFICDDFSTGFAKNIFTVHSRKFDYISSKIATAMVGSGVLMLVALLISVFFAPLMALPLAAL